MQGLGSASRAKKLSDGVEQKARIGFPLFTACPTHDNDKAWEIALVKLQGNKNLINSSRKRFLHMNPKPHRTSRKCKDMKFSKNSFTTAEIVDISSW
uniref:Uncharacterized protein n=1 Tax=Salix viminalis TaxID=40686 RepID=A0A6N2LRQ3_SALVM